MSARSKAAYRYVEKRGRRPDAWWGTDIANAFIAGAKWQKKKVKK